jgi:hypothetical protein
MPETLPGILREVLELSLVLVLEPLSRRSSRPCIGPSPRTWSKQFPNYCGLRIPQHGGPLRFLGDIDGGGGGGTSLCPCLRYVDEYWLA